MELEPSANLSKIRSERGGRIRFPIYINDKLKHTDLEALDLSTRSGNCLYRVGYRTMADLVESINGYEDLQKIRNCGKKSVDEIMEKLFCYQYNQLDSGKKLKFIRRVMELNT